MKTKIFLSVSLVLFGVGVILAYGYRLSQTSDTREPASTVAPAAAQAEAPKAQ